MKKKVEVFKLIFMTALALMLVLPIQAARSAVLHDNGPLVNSAGTHVGGGDESIMRTDSLGLTTYGFDLSHLYGNIIVQNYAVADNFVVPAGTTWEISSFDFFVFQEDATLPTITAAYLQIWNGEPGTDASSVWGDTTTNRSPTVSFTDTYIVLDTPGQDDDSRRVQKVSVATDTLSLGPGTYWAAWSCDDYGLQTARQYQPPVRYDVAATGDGLSYLFAAGIGIWSDAKDAGTNTGQDFPYIINGEYCTDLDEDGYGEGTLCGGTDCNDADDSVHELYTYYRDADGDGYGDEDNTTTLCGILTPPSGYVDDSLGFDVDDSDPFYTDILPTCEVNVMPRVLGWLIGDRERTKSLLITGKRGTDFGENPAIKWESDAIAVVSKRVFAKRFMFMRVTFNGESLDKQEYRVLVNDCEGSIAWAR